MNLATIIPQITLVLGVVLIVLILLQRPQTDSAGAFSSEGGSAAHTRRGAEKTIFRATILVAVLFALSSIIALFF